MAALGLDTWPSTQEEANALVGRSFCEEGFASTSWDKGIAKDFATKDKPPGVVLTVIIPKGTQGLYLSGGISEFESENEMLLQKGSEMTIRSATVKENRGLSELTVEVTRQNPEKLDERSQDEIEAEEREEAQRPKGGIKNFFKKITNIKNWFK